MQLCTVGPPKVYSNHDAVRNKEEEDDGDED